MANILLVLLFLFEVHGMTTRDSFYESDQSFEKDKKIHQIKEILNWCSQKFTNVSKFQIENNSSTYYLFRICQKIGQKKMEEVEKKESEVEVITEHISSVDDRQTIVVSTGFSFHNNQSSSSIFPQRTTFEINDHFVPLKDKLEKKNEDEFYIHDMESFADESVGDNFLEYSTENKITNSEDDPSQHFENDQTTLGNKNDFYSQDNEHWTNYKSEVNTEKSFSNDSQLDLYSTDDIRESLEKSYTANKVLKPSYNSELSLNKSTWSKGREFVNSSEEYDNTTNVLESAIDYSFDENDILFSSSSHNENSLLQNDKIILQNFYIGLGVLIGFGLLCLIVLIFTLEFKRRQLSSNNPFRSLTLKNSKMSSGASHKLGPWFNGQLQTLDRRNKANISFPTTVNLDNLENLVTEKSASLRSKITILSSSDGEEDNFSSEELFESRSKVMNQSTEVISSLESLTSSSSSSNDGVKTNITFSKNHDRLI